MHIFYHLSPYLSHNITGQAYIIALKTAGHTVEVNPEQATSCDIAIFHNDPAQIAKIRELYPVLQNIPSIAYVVFEGDILPPKYISLLRGITTIWTCSTFCKNIFQQHFSDVSVVPHIVERTHPNADAIALARKAMQVDATTFIFFSIIDGINPRKNLSTLLTCFSSLTKQMRTPVRLVLKQYRQEIDISAFAHVLSFYGSCTQEQMAAMHITADAYVSAHCAEGWGLGLSESMAYGKPVIATGYSGNMEFMNPSNSYPIPYTRVPIAPRMCELVPIFTPNMHWAKIDSKRFVATMKEVAQNPPDKELSRNAAHIAQLYSSTIIAQHMTRLLQKKLEQTP